MGTTSEVRRFAVYAAAALAGLGDLPDTLMSRSIIVRMRRRAPTETVEPFRRRLVACELEKLREQVADWIATIIPELTGAMPRLPQGIIDRPADCWEPLLAVADAAGGGWPERARRACVQLCQVSERREASLGIRLLADLRTVFEADERLHTETLLARLHAREEAPWGALRGKPLDARGLAGYLRAYEVHPADVKIAGVNRKGYRREDLHDAWLRYLPAAEATGVIAPDQ